jgi:hypothetical protein
MLSKSLTKHFKGFSSEFAELNAKLYRNVLLNFAIHCKERKREVLFFILVKTMVVHSAVSHGRLMQ